MANVNKVMLLGNITRDIEVRYTPKGAAVAELGLAVNRITKNDQGQKKEETTFVDVTLWGRQAELAGQYLAKGRPVFIEGRLQLDSWDDKQSGQKRTKLKVVGENLQFISGGDRSQQTPTPRTDTGGLPSATCGDLSHPNEDDIPF